MAIIVTHVVQNERQEDSFMVLRACFLVVASFIAHREVVDPCRTVLVLRTVAVHHWPSRLALDKGRFEHVGGDVVEVNGDDASRIHHPERSNPPLVDAERRDVDAGMEGGRAGVGTQVAQVPEELAQHSLVRGLTVLEALLPGDWTSKTSSEAPITSSLLPASVFVTMVAKTSSTMSFSFPFTYFPIRSAKRTLIFWIALTKSRIGDASCTRAATRRSIPRCWK